MEFIILVIVAIWYLLYRSKERRIDAEIEENAERESRNRNELISRLTDRNVEDELSRKMRASTVDKKLMEELQVSLAEMPWVNKPLTRIIMTSGGQRFCVRVLLANRGLIGCGDAFGGYNSSYEAMHDPIIFFGGTANSGYMKFIMWIRSTVEAKTGIRLYVSTCGWHEPREIQERTMDTRYTFKIR